MRQGLGITGAVRGDAVGDGAMLRELARGALRVTQFPGQAIAEETRFGEPHLGGALAGFLEQFGGGAEGVDGLIGFARVRHVTSIYTP